MTAPTCETNLPPFLFPEHYGEKLAKVMGKMLVVSQLAHLARKMKKTSKLPE